MCIGTDKHVWDSVGPITGSFLQSNENIVSFGSLEDPITALNVEKVEKHIRKHYPDSLLIVIDASICVSEEHHKQIEVRKGGIKPGKGAGKDLNRIGDYSILYYVHDENMDDKRIRNPFNGALEVLKEIEKILRG